MSDPNLSMQRQIQALQDDMERLRKADTPGGTQTWTPFFEGTSTAGAYTYVTQAGRYTIMGNRVFFEFDISISAIATPPVGNMLITGLPIVSGSGATYGPVAFSFISNIDLPAGKYAITAAVPPGGLTRINLYTAADNAGGALYPAASFTNVNCELIGGGHYEI